MKSIASILIVVALLGGCSDEQEPKQVYLTDILEEGRTVPIGNGFSIFVEKKDGATLRGVRITKKQPDGSEVRMEAETLVISQTTDKISLRMSDVTIYSGSSIRHQSVMVMECATVFDTKFKKTISECKKAIALNPDDVEAYYRMAVTYEDVWKYENAIAAYKKIIALTPNDPGAYCDIGIAYDKSEQYADAIAAFKKAVALKPDYANAYNCMGLTYDKLEQWPKAIAAYRKVIALQPSGEMTPRLRQRIFDIENRD
ncbi:MAG: tetratricopeptide repeat protein [Phycisphaerales bacterium]|jgi:Flp pilus assembly protein TadD|nr:tetratricopeptide repeat protein [Phycisphaerales bacterium]